ncbi:hypothetical protein D3C71_2073030 [compost metagenome]
MFGAEPFLVKRGHFAALDHAARDAVDQFLEFGIVLAQADAVGLDGQTFVQELVPVHGFAQAGQRDPDACVVGKGRVGLTLGQCVDGI